MSVEEKDFGFKRSYQVDLNPELPSTGGWPLPVFTFGERGNETVSVRVTPDGGKPWLASFALETRGLLNGVYACPGPAHLVVLTGADGFLVPANDPGATEKLPIHPTVWVTRPTGTDLLLVGSFTDALAIGVGGIRWVTERLFTDDLEFVVGPPGTIHVRGRVGAQSEPTVIELDPATGRTL